MPLYIYQYPDGSRVEVEQRLSEESITHLPCTWCDGSGVDEYDQSDDCQYAQYGYPYCEYCDGTGELKVHRVPQAPGIRLVGKGFYRTGG